MAALSRQRTEPEEIGANLLRPRHVVGRRPADRDQGHAARRPRLYRNGGCCRAPTHLLARSRSLPCIDTVISAYRPKAQASYRTLQCQGDKVAAYGGLGVLATVLGVNYGKAASAGLNRKSLLILF